MTEAILQLAAPRSVTGIDPAENYLSHIRTRVTDNRATFLTGNAQLLPVETASFDMVVTGLVLNFIPDTEQAMAEMTRAVKPGGTVAAYLWDYSERMQFMRHFWNAAVALDPSAASLDEGIRFSLCHREPLVELFLNTGLTRVNVLPIDIWTVFSSFDDYWLPFLGGQGPAPGYAASLREEHSEALRNRIRDGLPFALDGSIPLIARAWAVRGVAE